MKHLFILTLAVSCFLVGCEQQNQSAVSGTKEINLPLLDDATEYNSSSFETIHLENCEGCIIGMISQLVVADDAFYILDEASKAVFKFDRQGKLNFKIANHGKGPGEFIDPKWISLDADNQDIFIYDPRQHKILKYKASDGTYSGSTTELDFNARSFQFLPNQEGFIFYTSFLQNKEVESGNNSYQLIFTDLQGNVKNTAAPFDKGHLVTNFIGISDVYSAVQDSLFVFSQYRDTLYYVDENYTLKPAYSLNFEFENQKLSDHYLAEMLDSKTSDFKLIKQKRESSGVFHLYRQYHTNRHIYLTGVQSGKSYHFFFVKEKGETINVKPSGIPMNILASDDTHFYTYLSPVFSSKNLSPELRSMHSQLGEGDNPIIVAVKL